MYITKVLTLLLVLQCCELCLTIKVPVVWDNGADSDINENDDNNQQEASVEPRKPQNTQKLIPVEYFEYNVPKPQFAIEVAQFHGVPNPEQHYKAYPIKPYTNKEPPQFGIHHMQDEDQRVFQPYQQYLNKNDGIKTHAKPASTQYEIFHPYKAEEPALQAIYKDPVLAKIRTDLENSKNRLQNYEKEAGKPHITKDEYLETPEETDRKLFPHNNAPAPYEIHRPERRPVYYKAPIRYNHRDNVLNQKFRHPLNQNYIKIRPLHYRPLKNHLQQLRQHHAIKYDDERNEYPQVHPAEYNAEPEEGYDIFEKGREKYTQLSNNVDKSINKAVKENQPVEYQKQELQNGENNDHNNNDDDEEEFVPVKNYAQVRKTEVTKHLPKEAAFDDAETLEEILNAPRLREAVKSKKAQTVYTEEGYDDSAYDHAGEQKHASEQEGHGGHLKENQISGGLYKIPSVSTKFEDGRGSVYQDKTLHGEKWKNNNKDEEEEKEDEDYSEAENEQYVGAKSFKENSPNDANLRNKREKTSNANNDPIPQLENETNFQHEVDKREVNFKVPEINFTTTFLSEAEILKLAKQKRRPKKDDIKEKYPYYFKSLKEIHKNSPLRYAENFKFIPKKSNGGTEFYDSRSKLECSEVEEVDPLPEKLKNGENPTEDETNSGETGEKSHKDKKFETVKCQPRLKGLGDKIDCFKAKYFGENPLDSPFFKEELISNPEPITAPKLAAYKLETTKQTNQAPKIGKIFDEYEKYKDDKTDVFVLLDKFRTDQNKLHEPLIKKNEELTKSLYSSPATSANNTQQSNVYNDVIENIKNNIQAAQKQTNTKVLKTLLDSKKTAPNITYNYYQNKDDVTKPPQKLRRKRATPFVYEPYKILRDVQVQDSKKTTTSGNVSPLIKQLQSSRVVDRVNKSNQENEKQVKRNTNSQTLQYVDIGKKDREKTTSKGKNYEKTIVDVSVDPRRGEPRYEIKHANHKLEYTPVENKKSMSVEDYKAQTTTKRSTVKKENDSTTQKPTRTVQRTRLRKTTVRPAYEMSQLIPKQTEIQNVAASNTVRKTVTTSAPENEAKKLRRSKKEPTVEVSSEEEYGEYEEEEVTPTTTTKPTFRRRIRTTSTTTEKPQEEEEEVPEPELPRLRLITRFRNTPTEKPKIKPKSTEPPTVKKYNEEYDIAIPKYREKKKKTSTSTIVTDTKKYGDDEEDDDMRREEVDALIGVTESLDDYIPLYEKEARERRTQNNSAEDNNEEDNLDDDDDEDDEEDDDEEEDDEESEEEEEDEPEVTVTTPEPTKRTLVRTTDAPEPTTASRSEQRQNKPIVTKKKIEIHKETPVNKSSPHVSQFKQDIKEVEIIKEIPSLSKRKPQKNPEVLELYKDDSLAEDINKLGDVEIFSENIDLDKGPKHGGNYRVATKEDIKQLAELSKPKDAVASQSKNTKHNIELDNYAPQKMHGGNLKSISDIQRPRQRGRSSKLVELSNPLIGGMHGGNLRYGSKGRRGGRKNEKLIEIDDDKDNDRDDNSSSREDNFKSFDTRQERMHGGNYRSAKLEQAPETATDEGNKVARKDARKNGARLLNSFAQAVPILTTTPGYILDPSKRMYYYVD